MTPTKWANTLKQFVGKLPTNCLSVFGHLLIWRLKVYYEKERVKLLAKFCFFLGRAPDNFDLKEVIIDGKLHSLKKVISHDLDVMYIHKPCLIGDSKDSNTPLRRHPISDYPGFYYLTKPGTISNDKLDKLFRRCIDDDGYIIGRRILEESKKHLNSKVFSTATDCKTHASEIVVENGDSARSNENANFEENNLPLIASQNNVTESIKGKVSAKECTGKIASVNLGQIGQMLINQVNCQCSHCKTPSLVSSPSISVDFGGGFEFVNAERESRYNMPRLMAVIMAMEEAKKASQKRSSEDEDDRYGPRYKSCDMVNVFPLSSWPAEALSFSTTERKSSWPNAVMLKELRNCERFLVCKGVPLLQNSDKMVHLSFSEAEILLSKWVPEALRVYYRWSKLLFKMHLSSTKILSSYHFKTMFFWFLEVVSEDTFNGAPARYYIKFLKTILDACKRHYVPNYFYRKINMVKDIDKTTMNQFISKLEHICLHLQHYFKETISSDRIEQCDNAQAVYRISQLVLRIIKVCFFPNGKYLTEFENWDYVFFTLSGHRFSDSEIKELILNLKEFLENKGHSHREHFVDIIKILTRGEFKSEKQFWKYAMSKRIFLNFSDTIVETLAVFLKKYGNLHPDILNHDLDWHVESEFC